MRVLIGAQVGEVDVAGVEKEYAAPRTPWLRVNMISTLDGAATGPTGKSGSINNEPDHVVFDALRRICDCVVVGAGTVRIEGYTPMEKPIVVCSRTGSVPPTLRGAPPGSVRLATSASAEYLDEARELLGEEHVHVLGEHGVDLVRLREELAGLGLVNVLSEGGPHLLRSMLEAGVVDELDATYVPRVIGGDHLRMLEGAPLDVHLTLEALLEEDGTLLGRWFVAR